MAALKTKKNDQSVTQFIANIAEDSKRAYAETLCQLMEKLTGEPAVMWGDSIVGFGAYHYRYDSGREGDWFLTGFSPRKQNMTVYIMPGFDRYPTILSNLGKYKTGKSCLYFKKLEDINLDLLSTLISESVQYMRNRYPAPGDATS